MFRHGNFSKKWWCVGVAGSEVGTFLNVEEFMTIELSPQMFGMI